MIWWSIFFFIRTFDNLERYFSAPPNLVLFYAGLTSSKGEARRLIAQGAVEINGEILNPDVVLLAINVGTTIKVGKRRFVSIGNGTSDA